MLLGHTRIITGIFLRCISVEFPAYRIKTIQYMKCLSSGGSLKDHVLNEMGNAIQGGYFIPCAGIDQNGHINNLTARIRKKQSFKTGGKIPDFWL
jgi:hypothetical protein